MTFGKIGEYFLAAASFAVMGMATGYVVIDLVSRPIYSVATDQPLDSSPIHGGPGIPIGAACGGLAGLLIENKQQRKQS